MAANPVPELPPSCRPASIREAYALQRVLHDCLADSGQGRLVGWKVGATTAGMQRYLGVEGPAYGGILSANVHADGAELSRRAFCNPGIECEIAVLIGADAPDHRHTKDSVASLIEAVFPAMEIVENRYGDFLRRGTPSLVADDFFHKACVTGKPTDKWREIDLSAVTGRTVVGGTERGTGRGADVLGHPLAAVAWLANALAAAEERLRAGHIVLTGSVTPVIWLDEGPEDVRIELSGLGSVTARFA